MNELRKDALAVKIFETREEMGQSAASDAIVCIKTLLIKKSTVNVMFAAAPSQNEFLKALAESDVDWTRVNAFHMDEYVGLDSSHPAGFRNFLKKAIFDKCNFRSVNLINGNCDTPEAECVRYGKLLYENPLDICLMGVGENGHIAFNDPTVADFHDEKKIKIVKLEEVCRLQQVHDGCFQKLDDVPSCAFTVTIPVLASALHVFCVVPAITKAHAIQKMLNGPVSEACPASILRRHANATLYLDRDAASLL